MFIKLKGRLKDAKGLLRTLDDLKGFRTVINKKTLRDDKGTLEP
jgi:hypothetical protein